MNMTLSGRDARWRFSNITVLLVMLASCSKTSSSSLPALGIRPFVQVRPDDHAHHRRPQIGPLAKRITDDEIRAEWAARGCKLIAYMEEGNMQPLYRTMKSDGVLSPAQLRLRTSQSVFTDYDELASNGWTRNPERRLADRLNFVESHADVAILDVFADLQISASVRTRDNPNGDNELVAWEQDQDFYNGARGESTRASYTIIYNTLNGIIIRQFIKSPEKMRDTVYGNGDGDEKDWRNIPGLQLPHLRLVSDVASLEYAALCQKFHHRPMNFRYSIDFDVENSDTNEIIHLVLERRGYTEMDSQGVYLVARPWSRRLIIDRTNPSDWEDFQSLVGSPNVRGTAWMLIQHSRLFGHKRIRRIAIWKPEDEYYRLPCILVEVEDVPIVSSLGSG